jgi:hypothetical protein
MVGNDSIKGKKEQYMPGPRKGRPPGSVMSKLKQFTRMEIEETFHRFMRMKIQDVRNIDQSTTHGMLEMILAKIFLKAHEDGCITRLNLILDRVIGRVADNRPMILDAVPGMDINAQKEQIEKAIVYEVLMSETGKFLSQRPRLVSSSE